MPAPEPPSGGTAVSTAEPRILVIANRTASTPVMLDLIKERAGAGARFTLLVPPEHAHHDDWSQEVALERVGNAAGGEVAAMDAGDDPLDRVHRAVSDGEFDELIVCTAPTHLERWVHHDLPHRLQHLGVPVVVIPPEHDAPIPTHISDALPDDTTIVAMPGGGGQF
jgi:hypothetical protein